MITAVRKVGEYLGGVALIHAGLHNTVTLVPNTTHRAASTHVLLNTQLHSPIPCTLHNVGLWLSMPPFTTHADWPYSIEPMPCYGCSCVMLYLLVSMLKYSINAVISWGGGRVKSLLFEWSHQTLEHTLIRCLIFVTLLHFWSIWSLKG